MPFDHERTRAVLQRLQALAILSHIHGSNQVDMQKGLPSVDGESSARRPACATYTTGTTQHALRSEL